MVPAMAGGLEERYVDGQVVAAGSDGDQRGGDEPAPDGPPGQAGAALGVTETEQPADADGERDEAEQSDDTRRDLEEEHGHADGGHDEEAEPEPPARRRCDGPVPPVRPRP
jgi:hypothetical protein